MTQTTVVWFWFYFFFSHILREKRVCLEVQMLAWNLGDLHSGICLASDSLVYAGPNPSAFCPSFSKEDCVSIPLRCKVNTCEEFSYSMRESHIRP